MKITLDFISQVFLKVFDFLGKILFAATWIVAEIVGSFFSPKPHWIPAKDLGEVSCSPQQLPDYYPETELIAECRGPVVNLPSQTAFLAKEAHLCILRYKEAHKWDKKGVVPVPGVAIRGKVVFTNNLGARVHFLEPFEYKGWHMKPAIEDLNTIQISTGSNKSNYHFEGIFNKGPSVLTVRLRNSQSQQKVEEWYHFHMDCKKIKSTPAEKVTHP